MPSVKFSKLLASKLRLKQNEIFLPTSNLKEMFYFLGKKINGFKEIALTDSGEVNQFLAVCINNELVDKNNLDIQLNDSDKIIIINMIAGG